MIGYSIKEFVGDVSVEWVYDSGTDKVYLTERVGEVFETVEVDTNELDDKVFQAFTLLFEREPNKEGLLSEG